MTDQSERIALVSCVARKRPYASRAADLYTSTLFLGMRRFAERTCDAWYILSAQYGLVRPDEVIQPYDATLLRMATNERIAWASSICASLSAVLPRGCAVVVLAGAKYREQLVPWLKRDGFGVSIPLEGLRIGEQLQRLAQMR